MTIENEPCECLQCQLVALFLRLMQLSRHTTGKLSEDIGLIALAVGDLVLKTGKVQL